MAEVKAAKPNPNSGGAAAAAGGNVDIGLSTSPPPLAASPVETECVICMEAFDPDKSGKQPLMLSCGHSFCLKCLSHYDPKGQIVCPSCRKITPIPAGGSSALPKNYTLIDLLRSLQAGAPASANGGAAVLPNVPVTPCGICAKAAAVEYCLDCPAHICRAFCRSCFDADHKQGINARHKHVPFHKRPLEEPKCPEHGERMIFFCKQCEVPICIYCREVEAPHQGHPHTTVKQVGASFNDSIQVELSAAMTDIKELQRLLDQDAAAVRATEQSATDAIRSTSEHFKAIHAALLARENAICAMVAVERDKTVTSLNARRKNIAMTVTDLRAAADSAQVVLRQDIYGVLTAKKNTMEALKAARAASAGHVSAYIDAETATVVTLPNSAIEAVQQHASVRPHDTIEVALKRRREAEERKQQAETEEKDRFCFDPAFKDARYNLTQENRTVTHSGGGHGWVVAAKSFSAGRHTWRCKIDNGSYWISFGVLENRPAVLPQNQYMLPGLWAVSTTGQSLRAGALTEKASFEMKQGDVVQCELDCDVGTFTISVIARGQTFKFDNLPRGKELWPVFDLYSQHNQITLLH